MLFLPLVVPYRLQHHPKLYASVHKKHHEWHAPIAIVFTYSTPIEYIMTIIPVNIVSHSFPLTHFVFVCKERILKMNSFPVHVRAQ